MKKFELTTEFITVFGIKLFRIRALIAFGNVEAGELGGFVEKEENLSHDNRAWIYGNARICGDAEIYGNARIYGNAEIYGNARIYGDARICGNAEISKPTHVLVIGALGSRNGCTTFFRNKENTILVRCGCFANNIVKFEKAVEETHGGTKHEWTYKAAIALAKLQIYLED